MLRWHTMAPNATLPRSGRHGWTYADYCRIPEDRRRHEIIDGRHYVTPSPGVRHQRVSLRLASALLDAIANAGRGEVFDAPLDVHLGRGTLVQPDIVAVRAANCAIVGEQKIRGVPDLVVEILSPSTSARDRGVKRRRYERAGVRELWIVDTETRELEQFVLARGRYAWAVVCHDRVLLRAFRGVEIDLRETW